MVDIDYVRRVLSYDKDTGVLTWKERVAIRVMIGKPAGSLNNYGYIKVTLKGKQYMAHRLAWLLHTGQWPRQVIDHINGNPSDNRICNLRDVSLADNCTNRNSPVKAKSGYRGVVWQGWSNNAWRACIGIDNKKVFLGYFKTPELAHAAYLAAKYERLRQIVA